MVDEHGQMECGCYVATRDGEIEFCDLHSAAPDMLEALVPFAKLLDPAIKRLPDDQNVWGFNYADITAGDIKRAQVAIAKAHGTTPQREQSGE